MGNRRINRGNEGQCGRDIHSPGPARMIEKACQARVKRKAVAIFCCIKRETIGLITQGSTFPVYHY